MVKASALCNNKLLSYSHLEVVSVETSFTWSMRADWSLLALVPLYLSGRSLRALILYAATIAWFLAVQETKSIRYSFKKRPSTYATVPSEGRWVLGATTSNEMLVDFDFSQILVEMLDEDRAISVNVVGGGGIGLVVLW